MTVAPTPAPAPTRGPNLTLELLVLAAPIVMQSLAFSLIGFTDTLFMGRVSTDAQAAVGLGGLVYLTAFLLLRGTVNGVMPFASQAFGAGKLEECGRTLRQFLWLAALCSLLVPVYWWLFGPIFDLTGAAPAVRDGALEYARIRLLEVPLALASAACMGFLLAIGNSRTPMLVTWATVVLNVILNAVLVFGMFGFPALGLRGSAIASVIAVSLGGIVAALVVLSRTNIARFGIRFAAPDLMDLARLLKVSLPMGFLEFVEVGAFSAFLALTARLGTAELAASQIANQISSLAFMPGFGLSNAAASLVGRNIGARDLETARRTGYVGTYLGVAWMGVVGVLFWAFAEPLTRVFTGDAAVVPMGAQLLRLMAFYQVFDAANIVFRGSLIGAGDTRFTALVTLVGAWVVMLGGGAFFAFVLRWGVVGAWLGPFVYLTVLAFVYAARWRSGVWTRGLVA